MAWIEKRGKGYRISVSCGLDKDNKQIYERMKWTPPPGMTERQIEKELKRLEIKFEESVNNGVHVDGNTRFSDYKDMWLESCEQANLKKKTLKRYSELLDAASAELGSMRMAKIHPHHIMKYYAKLAEPSARKNTTYLPVNVDTLKKKIAGKTPEDLMVSESVIKSCRAGKAISKGSAEKISKSLGAKVSSLFQPKNTKPLAASTIHYTHRVLKALFNHASTGEWRILAVNPMDGVTAPKASASEPKYLEEDGADALLTALETEPIQHQVMVHVLIYLGLRRGELCGLEWKDFDFTKNVVAIKRSSLYLPEFGIYTDTPKSKSGTRAIKMPKCLSDTLRAYRVWQNQERLKLGSLWQDTDRLFTQWDGKPIHPDTVTSWFRNFIEKNNLESCTPHSLRHTNATLQIAGGVPITTVSRRLGHANPAITTKTYAHAIRSADEAAAETIEDILHPIK